MNLFWKKLTAIGFLFFLVLFLIGMVRNFSLDKAELPTLANSGFSVASSYDEHRSSMATANNLAQIGLSKTPLPQVLQEPDLSKIVVFDKTAELVSGSMTFTEDEQLVRTAIAAQKAVTFSEKARGITPDRLLVLGISVHPERFDVLLGQLSKIGNLESFQVLQQDRTGEFRKLLAQRQSLQKHLEAILKLREAAAKSVEETLKLEAKILEIEKENQVLGVQLGDLLGKEPSYNLFLTLEESRPGSRHDNSISLSQRLATGLMWAVRWWALGAFTTGLFLGAWFSIETLRSKQPPQTPAQ